MNLVNDLLFAEIQGQRDALMMHLVNSMFKLVSTDIVFISTVNRYNYVSFSKDIRSKCSDGGTSI